MKKNNFKTITVLIAIAGLLVFLYFVDFLSPIRGVVHKGLSPAMSHLYSFGSNIKNAYRKQADKLDMAGEMRVLEEKVDRLLVENAELKEIKEENERLRGHLDFLDNKDFGYKMAHVISKGLAVALKESEKDIIIDKGKAQGLYPGLAVVNSQGVLVGKIAKVDENVSRVNLSNNEDCKLAATIQNNDRTIGIVKGELGLTMRMDFIAQNEQINEGDLVVTSGLEESIPRGLVVGEVSRIDSSSNEIWKSVVIESPADFEDLIMVSVIMP